jgi:iron complex transport system substrate-binding protein
MARKLTFFLFFTVLFGLHIFPETGRAAKITVTDMAGRRLQVPAEIKTVIPLGAATRYMVYLQSLDLVAGMEAIETKWTTAGRPYGLVTFKRAKTLPVIGEGGPGRLPDFEKIITVWPDVILAMGIDLNQVETIQEKTGIPVFVLSYGPPGAVDIATVKKAIQTLGHLLGRNDRANQLVGYITSLEKDLISRTATVTDNNRPRTYVGAVSYMGVQPITSTESHFMPLVWAGGCNVADEIGRCGHFFIDPEKLLVWNPEAIFIDAGGLEKVIDGYRRDPAFFRRLKAVKEGHVFLIMPYNNYHTNIEISLADAWFIGKSLYPSRFTDIDPAVKADQIFTFFLGVKAYTALKKEYHGFSQVSFTNNGLILN